MKKTTNTWSFKKLFFIFLSIFILNLLFELYNQSSASIGIIGGADGPTAIFLANKAGTSRAGFFIILFLIVIALYFPLRKWLKK